MKYTKTKADLAEFLKFLFGDAPDGFSEELKEFTWALGAEYTYQDAFMVRTGYFNESEDKGL